MTMPGGRPAGAVYLTLLPDARQLGPRMVAQAKAAAITTERKAGKVKIAPDTRAFGPQLLQGMRRPLKQAGSEGQAAFKWLAAGTVAVGINQAIQAASSLNETVSKSRVVFGPASKTVEAFGKGAATSIGMSTQAAMENAATLGNLFVSMKLGRDQAAQMSTTMVQLAGDMASFNNASPQETLDAIRAGLVGETEPLRRFGVNLNEAALKAEAMRLGLGKIGPTLTAQQRTQAAYSLILQQTKTAQGDFARTSEGLANRQRILAAQYKDAQAALGKGLLPVMSTAVGFASDLASSFASLDESTGGLSTKLILGTVALAGLGYAAGKTFIFVRNVQGAWAAYRATQITATAASEVAAASQVRLAAATTVSGASATGAAGAFGGLRGALLGLSAAASAAFVVVGVGREQLKGLRGDTTAAGDPVTWLAKQLGLWHGKAKEAAAGTKEASDAAGAAKGITNAYKDALAQLGGTGGAAGATPKIAALTDKIKAQRDAINANKEATTEAVLSYKGLISQSKLTTAEVIADIRNQVANFKTYKTDVRRLIKAGVDPEAIRELSAKGPEYLHRLATGSNRELNVYKRYWRDRQAEVKGGFAKSLNEQVADLQTKIRKMNAEIQKLKGKTVPVGVEGTIHWDKNAALLKSLTGNFSHKLPAFRKGGKLAGYGGGDIRLIRAEPGEVVVPKEKARKDDFRFWAEQEGIPGFRTGGLIEAARAPRKLPPPTSDALRYATRSALTGASTLRGRDALAVLGGGGGGLGGGSGPGGWQWQMAVLRQAFPGLPMISGYRTRYFTATGGHSYHNLGRAVDVPPRMDVFNWIRAAYGARTKELIFSPAGMRQIHNGQPHMYTGVTRADHWNHVHWAYRRGAWKVLADQIARVHKGEMIVPAAPAEQIRRNAGRAGGQSAAELAAAFRDELDRRPLAVYLDRTKVSRELRTGLLWEDRR